MDSKKISIVLWIITFILIQNSEAKEYIQTDDFILFEKGEYLINPSYINILRRINIESTQKIMNSLEAVITQYDNFCDNFRQNIIQFKYENWISLKHKANNRKYAESQCKQLFNASLLEIRKPEDRMKALIFFMSIPHHLKQ